MSDTKTTKKTRKRAITVTDEALANYREIGNDNPSPMAVLLRGLPDIEAKKIIQRSENVAEKASKSALDNDENYQTARKGFEAAKNTYYRTRNKLNVTQVRIPNPDFDPDEEVSGENPEMIIIERDQYQTQVASLEAKIAEVLAQRAAAAGEVADGTDPNIPEGVLHRNMREAKARKRALARQVMGLNGTDAETPEDVLTDGE